MVQMMVRPLLAIATRLFTTLWAAKLSKPDVGSSAKRRGGSVKICRGRTKENGTQVYKEGYALVHANSLYFDVLEKH